MQDMFHNSGFPNNFDGRCSLCPFRTDTDCAETEQDVSIYVHNWHINSNCPYITKEEI